MDQTLLLRARRWQENGPFRPVRARPGFDVCIGLVPDVQDAEMEAEVTMDCINEPAVITYASADLLSVIVFTGTTRGISLSD